MPGIPPILVNGLTGSANQFLIAQYQLGFVTVEIEEVKPAAGGGGGPYPGSAWNKIDNIQNFFQPVQDFYDPTKTFKVKKQVTVKIDIGDIHVEKVYLVPIQRADTIVSVLNIVDATKEKINVSVNNLRRVLHNIKVSVRNLKRKK